MLLHQQCPLLIWTPKFWLTYSINNRLLFQSQKGYRKVLELLNNDRSVNPELWDETTKDLFEMFYNYTKKKFTDYMNFVSLSL